MTGIMPLKYKKQQLVEQMKNEVLATLSNLFNEVGRVNKGEESIGVYDLPSQTDEIRFPWSKLHAYTTIWSTGRGFGALSHWPSISIDIKEIIANQGATDEHATDVGFHGGLRDGVYGFVRGDSQWPF